MCWRNWKLCKVRCRNSEKFIAFVAEAELETEKDFLWLAATNYMKNFIRRFWIMKKQRRKLNKKNTNRV
ncbi:hypothetical protein D3Z55_17160 [Clostridiaceae bacterium]|jgi:hypothetical protein|nr:hypothetical protein [Clostridiaceae bacterium]